MATKKKTTEAEKTEAATLKDRILTFFRVQPYGEPCNLDDLYADLADDELKGFVGKEETDSILKRLENDKFSLPEKAAERQAVARKWAVEKALDQLVKDSSLTRIKMDEPDRPGGMGWYYSGPERPTGAEAKGQIHWLPIDQIKLDPKAIQCRAKPADPKLIDQYAADADKLPPGRVFKLEDGTLLLSRGFTRMAAWAQAGFQKVPMELVEGTREDAKLDAIGDNATHGKQRTSDDIREAVGKFLSLPGRKNASTASIAEAVRISWATADRYARALRRAKGEKEKPDTVTSSRGERPGTVTPKSGAVDADKAPETAAPNPAEAPKPPADSGVKDRAGNPIPADKSDMVAAFTDTRMRDAISNIIANLNFIRAVRPDGYALLSLPVKERDGLLTEIEWKVGTLQQALPYAITPADATAVAGENLKSAAKRGFMDKAEWDAYQKAAGKPKGGKGKGKGKAEEAPKPAEPAAPTPAPEAVPTEPAPTAEAPANGTPATAA